MIPYPKDIHNVPGLAKGKVPHTHGRGSSGHFATLSTRTCVCLHWLVLKLAKIFYAI